MNTPKHPPLTTQKGFSPVFTAIERSWRSGCHEPVYQTYIIIPGTTTIAIVLLYMMSVSLIDSVNRGWMAIAVAFISHLSGLVTGVLGVLASSKSDPTAGWWIASTCILVLPALLMIGRKIESGAARLKNPLRRMH